MEREAAQALAEWAKAESRKLVANGEGPGSPIDLHLLELWRGQRPDLVKAMTEWGALNQLAHVVGDRIVQAMRQYSKAGMSEGEARSLAYAEWAMLDPGETDPWAQDAATTT